jgi:polysaccharide biosynthesis transport protein
MTLRHSGTSDPSQPGGSTGLHPFGERVAPSRNRQPMGPDETYLSPTGQHKGMQDQIAMVRARKWLVLLCIAAGVGIAAHRSVGRPSYYVATATITMPDEQEKDFYTPARIADPSLKYFKDYILSPQKTIAEVLNSQAVREAVVRSMSSSVSSGIRDVPQSPGFKAPGKTGTIHPNALPRASVSAQKRTSLVTVTTTSIDRDLALRSLEGYLSVFREHYEQKKNRDATKTLAWLQEGLERTKEELSKSQEALQDFKKQHGLLSPDGEAVLVRRLATGWMDQLGKPEASPSDGDDESSRPVGSEMRKPKVYETALPHLASLQSRLGTLQSQYADMGQTYAPTYPKMVMLRKKISLFQNMISDLGHQETAATAAQAQVQQEVDRKAREEDWQEIVRINAAGPEFRLLKMEVETNEKIHDMLFTEYKKAERRVSAAAEDIVIASPPSAFKIQPTYLKKLAIGGLIGLFSGLAIALTLGSMDTKVRSAGDIENYFGCKTLGTVPDLSSYRKPEPSGIAPNTDIIELLAHDDPDSPIFEPIRNIQSSVFLSSTGRSVKCLAVSSCLPGEGKTLIAVSLAAVMCLDKSKSVLVIDADLRRPRIHRVFGHSHPGNGLTTLVRRGSVDWSGMVHSSRLPGLYYLMSGPIARDPVATLQSETLEEVFASLKASFDLIVVDTPPLLGFSDAVIMSAMVDGTILVTEQGLVRRDIMAEALRSLSSTNATRLLGVVLNKARPPRKTWYGYYSGYSYRYGRYGKYA